tara:strand:- start:20 stop:190 length:171 start_codon:yes stop_codon:yes gene_type:complete
MITNLIYFLLITSLLILGGWAFKASIAILQGKPVEFNIQNPLNLKARWPKKKNEEN